MTLNFLSPLHRATRQIGLFLEPRTRELGLSPREAHVLAYLDAYGPAPVKDLQRIFGLHASTLTGLLDRLERKRLAARHTDPADRRSFLVEVSDEGRRTAEAVRATILDLEARIRRRVGAGHLEGFRRVMEAIEETTGITVRNKEQP